MRAGRALPGASPERLRTRELTFEERPSSPNNSAYERRPLHQEYSSASMIVITRKDYHYIFLGGRDLEKGPWVSYLPFGRLAIWAQISLRVQISLRWPVFLSRPIGTLSWLRAGGSRRRGTTIRTWGHDHCKATPTACAR